MSRRGLVAALWAVSAVIALVVGVLGGRATLAPPQGAAEAAPPATYTVAEATVGRSTTFRASVAWPTRTVAFSPVAGTVTAVEITSGERVQAGQVLFRVDLRPVVVAQGEVPAFRTLAAGTTGPDVAQVQRLLIGLGHLAGSTDGRFGTRTAAAVQRWQRSLGVPATGVVQNGDIVFAPQLPARVVLGEDVAIARRLDVGMAISPLRPTRR